MLVTLNEAIELIKSNKLLHFAADDTLLKQLPLGNWIGGTTPYFITKDGGILTKDKLYVTEIKNTDDFKISTYDSDKIMSITRDSYDNGYSLIILPFGSNTLVKFSKDAPKIEDIFLNNIIGWVSGFDLSDANACAKVYNGQTKEASNEKAVILHVKLPADKLASIAVVNIFEQDVTKPAITFESDGFEVEYCMVNGERMHFAEYISNNNIDTQLPFIADYMGTSVNISIKAIENGIVYLYAPVFSYMKYYFAKPIDNYVNEFRKNIEGFESIEPIFSCNCILNYLYGNLQGKTTNPFEGPITFGEIAYQLVNQTLVYLAFM